jgi:fructose/tagatose bisphosphate aldolase
LLKAILTVRSETETSESVDFAGDDAVRANVEEALKAYTGAVVRHYDHGSEEAWIRSDVKACVDLDNVWLLACKACYAQNCSSAKKLGVYNWKHEAKYWV